jgi:hypothetical protein
MVSEAAVESFETIMIAFACSRMIFAGQYLTSKLTKTSTRTV